MNYSKRLHEIRPQDRPRVGGKAYSLALMAQTGLRVPDTVCITTAAYNRFVTVTGLRERIALELNRKPFQEMRWEEIWDAALRIRNIFLNTPIPKSLQSALRTIIASHIGPRAVVVRSSAPEEDSAQASFAGLHESFVNVRGTDSILEHVKLVWASLWTDAALLYRQELDLDVNRSSMAVLVQEIVSGSRSGVAFSRSPNDPAVAAIEAVYGLNQGLVDGAIEPDRWLVDRDTGRIISHLAATREKLMAAAAQGVQLRSLSNRQKPRAPLSDGEVRRVMDLALTAENIFGAPQDVEWTFKRKALWVLQSRPITTVPANQADDKRQWYLSLRRSFENLKALRAKIELELIPAMIQDAAQLAARDLTRLTDQELLEEAERRRELEAKWVGVYWSEFIPFAHGVRLFGQIYNDTVRPQDPYEFVKLLGATAMESLSRNGMLDRMASMVREDPRLYEHLQRGDYLHADPQFSNLLQAFIDRFGDLSCLITGVVQCSQGPDGIIRLVLEMASHPPSPPKAVADDVDALREQFLQKFAGDDRAQALELIELARVSYQLRDDDNIHLARIEAQKLAAVNELKQRLEHGGLKGLEAERIERLTREVTSEGKGADKVDSSRAISADYLLQARQLVGQPAGPGLARGPARVIGGAEDLLRFKHGEILVCDAVDPNMTFVVPLAAAVVERRGGMLIHGAIIAREYGLPCVTGVPEATALIRSGDLLTVDGYLGIVTINQRGAD